MLKNTFNKWDFQKPDWGANFRKNYENHVSKIHPSNKPIDFLEIGVLEGRNAIWMLENHLEHPDSLYVGIDKNLRQNAIENLKGFEKCKLIKADSRICMKKIDKKFDVIYIDSLHKSHCCIIESAFAATMLKSNGNSIIIWDDYGKGIFPEVKIAVDNFLEFFEENKHYELLFKDYQVGIKMKNPGF